MQGPRTRRVLRVHLPQPLVARLGSAQVLLVDLSVLGARVEHHVPLIAGAHSRLSFDCDGEEVTMDCRIVRSRIERFSTGVDGMTVYHSGVEFEVISAETRARLKAMIARFIGRALQEQKLNARGVIPEHDADRMPIFRFGGQLSADGKNKAVAAPASAPVSRIAHETGYICFLLENDRWRRKRTHDPGQPASGFTISAHEEQTQAELLCDAYIRSDADGRRFIQLCAQMSIFEGDAAPTLGRFEP